MKEEMVSYDVVFQCSPEVTPAKQLLIAGRVIKLALEHTGSPLSLVST